jgi:quercetin dioxygenase-like cupin family protein
MAARRSSLKILAAGAVLAVGIVAFGSGVGTATPPINATSVLLAQGVVAHDFKARAVEGTDIVVAQNTFQAGGSSGWHSHPGTTVVTVQTGQITIHKELLGGGPCVVHTYSAGQTFVERPSYEINGVNEGTTETVAVVTFFRVPHGGSARIDQPDPGDCPPA